MSYKAASHASFTDKANLVRYWEKAQSVQDGAK